MSDLSLVAQAPLGGYRRKFDRATLVEIDDKALVSIAIPLGAEETLTQSIWSAYKALLPDQGLSSIDRPGSTLFLRLQRDQIFLLMTYCRDPAKVVASTLGNVAYYTDQSDSWAVLELSGLGCLAALERICMLDLSPSVFPVGAVARTTMEHLSVVVYRERMDSFLLMSPRSSAKSFLHTIELSIAYTG